MCDNHPDDWQHTVTVDADLRRPDSGMRIATTTKGELFLHRSLLPLDQVDLRTPAEKGQLSLFDEEALDICDSGYCFV